MVASDGRYPPHEELEDRAEGGAPRFARENRSFGVESARWHDAVAKRHGEKLQTPSDLGGGDSRSARRRGEKLQRPSDLEGGGSQSARWHDGVARRHGEQSEGEDSQSANGPVGVARRHGEQPEGEDSQSANGPVGGVETEAPAHALAVVSRELRLQAHLRGICRNVARAAKLVQWYRQRAGFRPALRAIAASRLRGGVRASAKSTKDTHLGTKVPLPPLLWSQCLHSHSRSGARWPLQKRA